MAGHSVQIDFWPSQL